MDKLVAQSGKCELLMTLLEPVLESGEKALIFTQYVGMAKMLSDLVCRHLAVRTLLFIGGMSVQQRDDVVSQFQSDPACQVLILSIKAGGVGL